MHSQMSWAKELFNRDFLILITNTFSLSYHFTILGVSCVLGHFSSQYQRWGAPSFLGKLMWKEGLPFQMVIQRLPKADIWAPRPHPQAYSVPSARECFFTSLLPVDILVTSPALSSVKPSWIAQWNFIAPNFLLPKKAACTVQRLWCSCTLISLPPKTKFLKGSARPNSGLCVLLLEDRP